MIETIEEYLNLVEKGDKESQWRLKSDTAPLFVWEGLISLYPDLKRVVTLNKTLSDCVIRLLANDVDAAVRCDVANRRGLPLDVFELLARDSDESVRCRIAWNKKTPDHVLRFLLSDDYDIVTEPVKKRLGLL